MLKLPLEALLERMFLEHSIPFSDRMYGEEIEDAATFMDEVGESTSRDLATNLMLATVFDQYWRHLAENQEAAFRVIGRDAHELLLAEGSIDYEGVLFQLEIIGADPLCADFRVYLEHHPDSKGNLDISATEFTEAIEINAGMARLHVNPRITNILGLLFSKATEEQRLVAFDTVPFFLRTSGSVQGLHIRYSVCAKSDRDQYRPIADQIVQEDDIGGEYVDFYADGHDLGGVYYRDRTDIPNSVSINLSAKPMREHFRNQGLDYDARASSLHALDEKSATPEELTAAIRQLLF